MRKIFLFIGTMFLACSIQAQDIFKQHGFNKEILTLSKGRYEEVFTSKEIVRVGSVLLNTKTNTIIEFLTEETEDTPFKAEHSSRWLTPDPLAEKHPEISPYVFCANNPVRYVDPDGRDWYRHDESGAVIWQEGNSASTTINDQVYGNIGETYNQTVGNTTYNYSQNSLESIDYATGATFQAQTTGTGCKAAADNMVRSSGATPSAGRTGEVLMANHDANGVATTPTANATAGVQRIESAIMDGNAITVGVDYKPQQQNNLAPSGDGMTDHFVAVVGMNVNVQTGSTTYRFYDPGSSRNGDSSANTMSSQGGFLQGRTAAYSQPFKVTTVRNSTR